MRRMFCDSCGKETDGVYTFDVGYDGPSNFSGTGVSWQRQEVFTYRPARPRIELCLECAQRAVSVVLDDLFPQSPAEAEEKSEDASTPGSGT